MSGMIPGVGLDERRRISCHRRIEDPRFPCVVKPEEYVVRDTELDPVIFEARNRLEKRLGRYVKPRVGSNGDIINKIWDTNWRKGLVKNGIFRRLWRFRSKENRHVCAICLDICYGDGEIMALKCSHKYHSKCLLPWLEAHSSCPYCRHPV
ncbi:hypothetical protein QQ045_009092 [Rhodiola kirilowii]